MSQSNCKVRIAVDLSFDELMNDKVDILFHSKNECHQFLKWSITDTFFLKYQEIGKCIKQLLRCYSLNRRAKDPVQFYITNFRGKCKKEMEKHSGYMNWDVSFQYLFTIECWTFRKSK
jgi:tRNA (guanine9-N1)-methyltransferase